MPPPIPDRYRLEVRLGRDGDIEQWLGTDTSLDRPVLVRLLGPDASESRREAFLAAVRSASAISHPHLASVYTAGTVPGGVYAVSDWTGGITLADRLGSGETIEVDEFLPNAAGVADALAGLHQEGIVHGSIDAGSVFYAVAHPAKLGAFGRAPVGHTPSDDVRALGAVLEEALTGAPAGGPPPSEVVDGLSPAVDRALRAARQGLITARALADELRAAPSPVPAPVEPPGWSRRLLVLAGALVLAALGLLGLGRLLTADPGGPPSLPTGTTRPGIELQTTTTTPPAASSTTTVVQLATVEARVVDPFGEGGENDQRVPNLTDGDPETAWRTESYLDPLRLLKPGVGVAFRTEGSPRVVQLSNVTPGTEYSIQWAAEPASGPSDWERLLSATAIASSAGHQLPERTGGWWIIWLEGLPRDTDGSYRASIGEVRFRA